LLLHKYYIDAFYIWLAEKGMLGLAALAQLFDAWVVDGIVNRVAEFTLMLGHDLREVETGKVQTYMLGFFGGVALFTVMIVALIEYVK
jgi:hypothetical protein